MALLYDWEDENVATPLISSFVDMMEISGSVTKLKEGCFGSRSNEYLLFTKRSLVLAATIQLSPSTRATFSGVVDHALELYALAHATSTDIIYHMT